MKFKVTFNSPVILIFIIIAFFATILDPHKVFFVNRTLATSSLTSPMTYIGFFTHIFGHINMQHFLSNASYLLLIGPMLEEKYGQAMLIKIIAITAFTEGVICYFLFHGGLGASGIVYSLILLTSFTNFKKGEIPMTFILIFITYIITEVFNGIFLNDNIGHSAHVIGGIVGAILGYKLNRKSELPS